MPVPIYVVDAFTSRPFAGNPAAVCLVDSEPDPVWMQNVAAEMRHSETAFVWPKDDCYGLRWYTPSVEVDLCGHATLAAAHVLWTAGRLGTEDPAFFDTSSGRITCTRHGYGIQMDFPVESIDREHPHAEAAVRALGLSAPPLFVGANRMDILVEVADQEAVGSIVPDMHALGEVDARGIIVTARSSSHDYDFVSRFFAPASGVPEDPVTGSAHCCLGPYWSEKLGKPAVVGLQCSERGGTVRVTVQGERVLLQGLAVMVLRGEFLS